MRMQDKHWNANQNQSILGVNFHRFLEMEGSANHMEIAEELGISLGEVKELKKRIIRT